MNALFYKLFRLKKSSATAISTVLGDFVKVWLKINVYMVLTSKTKKNLFILTIGFVVFVVWIFLIIWSTSKGKEQREQQKIFEKTEKEKVYQNITPLIDIPNHLGLDVKTLDKKLGKGEQEGGTVREYRMGKMLLVKFLNNSADNFVLFFSDSVCDVEKAMKYGGINVFNIPPDVVQGIDTKQWYQLEQNGKKFKATAISGEKVNCYEAIKIESR